MKRFANGPTRPNWHELVRTQGLVYVDTVLPSGETVSYWRERQYYTLLESETDLIGQANQALWDAYIEGGERMLAFERAWHGDPTHQERDCYFRKLAIPEWAIGAIMRTWQLDEPDGSPCQTVETEHYPCIYGRYDYSVERDSFGIITGVKLLEFNADTPTGLVESIIQWEWFESLHKTRGLDQWNSLYKDLIDRWVFELSEYRRKTGRLPFTVHLAYEVAEEEGEDYMTTVMMQQVVAKAASAMGNGRTPAFDVKLIALGDIDRIPTGEIVASAPFTGTYVGGFADKDGVKIEMIFKLHPWEHMLQSRYGFGQTVMHNILSDDPVIWVEAAYKLIWSNKGFLAVLWEFFKEDPRYAPYLLETYFRNDSNTPEGFMRNCAVKPILSREGANTTIFVDGIVVASGPDCHYGDEGYVVQALAPLPVFEDPSEGPMHAVIGSWMVGDKGSGICIRESRGLITDNQSYFAPTYVEMGV